jgi:hypothetical protein
MAGFDVTTEGRFSDLIGKQDEQQLHTGPVGASMLAPKSVCRSVFPVVGAHDDAGAHVHMGYDDLAQFIYEFAPVFKGKMAI